MYVETFIALYVFLCVLNQLVYPQMKFLRVSALNLYIVCWGCSASVFRHSRVYLCSP